MYGAFFRETGEMTGYALLLDRDDYIDFAVLKSNPDFEKFQVNAALVHKIVGDYSSIIQQGKYICDGARNILHETHFPDYLEKYFGFRKAYCKLHLVYSNKYKWLVNILYPIRGLLKRFDNIGKIHQINGVLTMESIVRKQEQDKVLKNYS